MSSSTSSSRAIFARVLLVITLGMAACYGIVRIFADLNDASAETILGRVMEARAALPRILAEERDLVMFFGSSMTRAGFSARLFDRQLEQSGIEVKSFNFGVGGLNPYFQDFFSRRIHEAFDERDRRLKLALIEFVPFQLTSARWRGAQPAVDSFLAMLASPREMFAMVPEDPTRGLQILNIHYLRNDVSAEITTWYFGQGLETPPPTSDLPEEDEDRQQRLQEIGDQLNEKFEEEYPDYVPSNFNYDWQGAGTIPDERSPETLELFTEFYELQRTPRRLENDKLQRTACCDIVELHFEEILVESFIRIVLEFQKFSDHVEVVLLPRNTEWIQYPPEAVARMQAVLDRIRRETGVEIRDYQDVGFGPEHFSDTTHLSRYGGDVPFTAFLAEEYEPVLAGLVAAGD